jgi:hypothetical protein
MSSPLFITLYTCAVLVSEAVVRSVMADGLCSFRYDTLGPESVAYICGHAELSAIACSAEALGSLLEALPDKPMVKLVVSDSRMLESMSGILALRPLAPMCHCGFIVEGERGGP